MKKLDTYFADELTMKQAKCRPVVDGQQVKPDTCHYSSSPDWLLIASLRPTSSLQLNFLLCLLDSFNILKAHENQNPVDCNAASVKSCISFVFQNTFMCFPTDQRDKSVVCSRS